MDNKRTAIVIGGSRGIGRAIAVRLAKSGFSILLTYQGNHAAAGEAKKMVEACGVPCQTLAFDIADREEVQHVFAPVVEEIQPEACVFNAGICRDGVFAMMPPDDWDSVMAANLDGFYNTVQCVAFGMVERRHGRIVAVTSISGDIGQAGQVNYAASKAGLTGAVRALAREVGRRGVFVNAVSPGVIETSMTANLPKDQILPLIPLHRFGRPEEVAAVVNFLCAEPEMYVQGQTIGVNGGMAV